jgi:hypothetical protein
MIGQKNIKEARLESEIEEIVLAKLFTRKDKIKNKYM